MKRLGCLLVLGAVATGAYAQNTSSPQAGGGGGRSGGGDDSKPGWVAAEARSADGVSTVEVVPAQPGKPVQVITKSKDGKLTITDDKRVVYGSGGVATFEGKPANGDPFGQLQAFKGYISTVGEYSRSAGDPQTTAIAAVMQAAELLRDKGPEAQVEYFTRVMGQAQNDTVKRAIRLQLIDAYKRANQAEKALDELKVLILAANKGDGEKGNR